MFTRPPGGGKSLFEPDHPGEMASKVSNRFLLSIWGRAECTLK